MKQFLNRESYCSAYLWVRFPALSTEKLRAKVFDGPQIRRLMQDKYFPLTMTTLEKKRFNHWKIQSKLSTITTF